MHRRRWQLLDRLIRVLGGRTGAFATPATATCVHTTTQESEHEGKAAKEDVRPIACYRALDVLLLLASRNGGV